MATGLRVALAQTDTVVGDLEGNAANTLAWAEKAFAAGADLLLMPECTLTGYPPEDLVLRGSFVRAATAVAEKLAGQLAEAGLGELPVLVGTVTQGEARPQNSALMLHRGQVVAHTAKTHLPNYGVFDEQRYFAPGTGLSVVRVRGVDVAVTICEDLWQAGGPVALAAETGVGLVVCINGSPYERDKLNVRQALSARRAAEAKAPIAYVNMVGGQDELIFDGASHVVSPDGVLLARAPQFVEHLLLADLVLAAGVGDKAGPCVRFTDLGGGLREIEPAGEVADVLDPVGEVWNALVVATRDYVTKNGFTSVALGLSGGIDSAVVATLAVDALGGGAVHTVALPSEYSSQHSLDDAEDLARRQGTHYTVRPIAAMVEAYRGVIGQDTDDLHKGLTEENLQARVRGTLLMALSNAENHLILTTGNKSELATGFSTLYGDSAGGFAPIKDVAKSLVWELARWRNARSPANPPIPENSITKAPSAELAPGQVDSDRLPPYEVLDAILDDYVTGDLGRGEIVARGFDPQTVDRVVRLVDLAEYKRRQNPPGPKITPKAFGRDRRLPITNRWREGS